MKITMPPVQVADDEGFIQEKDIFSRKNFGERLANLIVKSNEGLVLALDAEWGEGKSTFVKMWKGYIGYQHKPKMRSIYFDAFQNDYQKDPFLALVGELYGLLKDKSGDKEKEFKRTVAKVGKSLFRGAIKIGVSTATGGLLSGSVVDSAGKEISKLLADEVDYVIADRLQSTAEDKDALKEFRGFLEGFAKEHGGGHPIVFIIDELDRCRPDFALELIEQIKHLFSVPGITFLLVLNRKQLEASVSSRYGSNVVATTYLQKFVNLWIALPRKFDYYYDHGANYVQYVLDYMLDNGEENNNKEAVAVLKELVIGLKPSFREIERILSCYALVINMLGGTQTLSIYQFLIPFVCYLKVLQPSLFNNVANNEIAFSRLCDESGLNKIIDNSDYQNIKDLLQYIKFDLADQNKRQSMVAKNEIYIGNQPIRQRLVMADVCEWLNELKME